MEERWTPTNSYVTFRFGKRWPGLAFKAPGESGKMARSGALSCSPTQAKCHLIVKARREERLLTRHFPEVYPRYRARVWARLIPFLL
jgi:hypothetical protein